MRIDAHQHFWRIASRAGAWPPPALAKIHRDFEPEDLAPLLASHGIDGTVLVQSLPSAEDTLYMLALADRTPFVRAVVGWTDLKAADAPSHIATLARHPKLKGLRPMLQDLPDDGWITDPALAPAIAAMLEHGLALDALVLPRHLPALYKFAQRYPALPVVIDHAAKPPIAVGDAGRWRDDLARLATLANVHCKLSGLVTEAAPAWANADLQPYASHVLEVFGARRVIWGSDWPVLNLAADYHRWLETSEELLAGFDEISRQRVFGLNARAFYRID
jgi:L-fuconolactonase